METKLLLVIVLIKSKALIKSQVSVHLKLHQNILHHLEWIRIGLLKVSREFLQDFLDQRMLSCCQRRKVKRISLLDMVLKANLFSKEQSSKYLSRIWLFFRQRLGLEKGKVDLPEQSSGKGLINLLFLSKILY